MSIIGHMREQYEREKARLKGEGRSRARLIMNAKDIAGVSNQLADAQPDRHVGPIAQPIKGAGVRMLDGKPMVFYTDGSIRHALGRKTTKAARKALKRARRANAR